MVAGVVWRSSVCVSFPFPPLIPFPKHRTCVAHITPRFVFQTCARFEINDRKTNRYSGCLIFTFPRRCCTDFTVGFGLWSGLLPYSLEFRPGPDWVRAHPRFPCARPRRRPRCTPTLARKRSRRSTHRPNRRGGSM